jgi:phi LC3 family holin
MNLKSRLTHKAFWLSFISLVVLLLQQLGLTSLANYIPQNYADIINTVFALVALLGIAVDTSTDGFSDAINIPEQGVNTINTQEEIKGESTTTAVNNTVTENSQDVENGQNNVQA